MAWSQAARDAAAEIRRQHAAQKEGGRQVMLASNKFNRQIISDPTQRARIARNIRAFRKGGSARTKSIKLGYRADSLALEARSSTAARNVLRFGKRW